MNETNIDVILEKAASSKSDEDYQYFFNSIRNTELFFNLSSADVVENKNNEVKVPIVSIG